MRLGIAARIAVGYGIGLGLLIIVAVTGVTATLRTTTSFQAALSDLNAHAVAALQASGSFEEVTVSYLRYRLTADQLYLNTFENRASLVRRQLTALQAGSRGTSGAAWGQAATLFNTWDTQARATVAAMRTGHSASANHIFLTKVIPAHDALVALINRQVARTQARAATAARAASSAAARALWTLVAGAIVAVVAAVVAAWTLTRAIAGNLREAIATLSSAAAEMLAATTQQAAGTAEEAAAVQQTSTTIEELKQTVQVAVNKAEAVAEASQKTDQVSESGRRAVAETIQHMQNVRRQMEGLAGRILALSEQSQAIGGITATVKDLAEQSNLLAVNAAIEAAKAGEAGRGFAVVAAEVKSLADQSKQATAQVHGILADIQRATQAAVMAMEQGVKTVEAGETVAVQSGEALQLLTASISTSTQMARQILASAQQQVVGVDQISMAMHNIQQSSVQNMASTRQVERAAQNLNDLAGMLSALLKGARVRTVVAAVSPPLSSGGQRPR